MARNEVTIVTEYIPFRYFTRTASKTLVWEQVQSRRAMTWNQDSGGRDPGESIEYTKHRLSHRVIRGLGVIP